MTLRSMGLKKSYLALMLAVLVGSLGVPDQAPGQVMTDYTWSPITVNKAVKSNVLFLVDMGDATLEAAYGGTGYYYPLSFKSPLTYDSVAGIGFYASNTTLLNRILSTQNKAGGKVDCIVTAGTTATKALNLSDVPLSTTVLTKSAVATPVACATANPAVDFEEVEVTNLSDTFDPATQYYGYFDPERCYFHAAGKFQIGVDGSAVKGTGKYSNVCPDTKWDGNFLNWLATRKTEVIKKVFVGGRPIPAQANLDGSANTLTGYTKTGENGDANKKCASSMAPCWRYVKYVPYAQLKGRVPVALPNPYVVIAFPGSTLGTFKGSFAVLHGMFFGVGEGKIYVNDNAGDDPFDTALANTYAIDIDLTTEQDSPAGTGLKTTCPNPYDPNPNPIPANYAGHLACYKQQQSKGLFQKLAEGTDPLMHVGVMLVNANSGQGGSVFYGFDDAYNENVVAVLRSMPESAHSPLAESLYEALCLYRKSQGPCYNNPGAAGAAWATNFTSTIEAKGDPFYFTSYNSMVRCCKNYVILVSAGVGRSDGDFPDLQTPFPLNETLNPTTNIGVVTSAAVGDRLDDVAFYGRTHDVRSQANLAGDQYVKLFGVNAMGRKAGAKLIASAAANGGFEDKNKDNKTTHSIVNATTTPITAAGSTPQVCVYPPGSNLDPGTGGPFYSDPEWDAPDPVTKTGDCVPDTFYDANNGYQLADALQRAMNDILKQSSSGTSISVLASSSTGEGTIYQAYFYPETSEGDRTVKWTGHLQGLFIDSYGNLREDRSSGYTGVPDGRLVYTDDPIITTTVDSTTGDVVVNRFKSTASGQQDGAAYETVSLRETQGLWEAGRLLAERDLGTKPRNLFAWVDLNNDGVVTKDEQIAFNTGNAKTFERYLRADAAGTYTAGNIISFLNGEQISGMRDRKLTVGGAQKVWRLGDIVSSSPTIIGPPRERFDILYGDTGYRQFLQRWKNRRLVAYVGANDGMLHAFNGGYYHRGDDPSTSSKVEHGWYTTGETADDATKPQLGEELWGFVPHYILPQLRWYTQTDYTHIAYVDLKPKVTDVRIFTPEAACGSAATPTPTAAGCIHPDGWGTILIIGMRFGGSCGACVSPKGPPLSVTADFNSTGTTETRYFYSGYVVLDITDPETTPTVLSSFSSSSGGLTTAYPTVVRMSPKGDAKTDHTNAVWFMVAGSGMHGYDGEAAATSRLMASELVEQGKAPKVTTLGNSQYWSFMSDAITYDKDLDWRSDVVYTGQTLTGVCNPVMDKPTCTTNGTNWNKSPLNSPAGSQWWTGKLLRLTMGTCTGTCDTKTWGIWSSGTPTPTEVISKVPDGVGGTVPLGPMTASPSVTLDNSGSTWVFFGTGRYLSKADQSDQHQQYLIGVKDSVMNGCTQLTTTDCLDENLLDVSAAEICISCASGTQVQGVGATNTFPDLITQIQGMDGWMVRLASNSGSTTAGAERSVVNPTLIGGAIFFPTFTPGMDVCEAKGSSQIFGLYYMTGTGHIDPIFGTDANGMAKKSVSVGQGMASSMAVTISAEPTGMTGICQSSNAAFCLVKPKPPQVLWSQYLGWIAQRM